jgi:hypothetical protein
MRFHDSGGAVVSSKRQRTERWPLADKPALNLTASLDDGE